MADKKSLVSKYRRRRSTDLPNKKALGRTGAGAAKKEGGGGGGGGRFTYVLELDCGDGATARMTYNLRGGSGDYVEDLCGDVLEGSLSFVQDITITYEGDIELSGMIYNAEDAYGQFFYLFGTDDLDGQGSYLVMIGMGHYEPGSPPEFEIWGVGRRSQN